MIIESILIVLGILTILIGIWNLIIGSYIWGILFVLGGIWSTALGIYYITQIRKQKKEQAEEEAKKQQAEAAAANFSLEDVLLSEDLFQTNQQSWQAPQQKSQNRQSTQFQQTQSTSYKDIATENTEPDNFKASEPPAPQPENIPVAKPENIQADVEVEETQSVEQKMPESEIIEQEPLLTPITIEEPKPVEDLQDDEDIFGQIWSIGSSSESFDEGLQSNYQSSDNSNPFPGYNYQTDTEQNTDNFIYNDAPRENKRQTKKGPLFNQNSFQASTENKTVFSGNPEDKSAAPSQNSPKNSAAPSSKDEKYGNTANQDNESLLGKTIDFFKPVKNKKNTQNTSAPVSEYEVDHILDEFLIQEDSNPKDE